jgi:hypothetical protein
VLCRETLSQFGLNRSRPGGAIADDVEPAAALALVWAIDRWVERD